MNINDKGEIIVTGKQLVYLYGMLHVLYTFGTHYAWVWKTRKAAKGYNATSGSSSGSICGKCMIYQFIPRLLFGLEWKILQVLTLCFTWVIKVLLGGSSAMPFKIKLFKEPRVSFFPACNHR